MAEPMTKNDINSICYVAEGSPLPQLIVVDEEQVYAKSVSEIAQDLGYRVKTSARIGDVIQACKLDPPELIVIGHISPDLDGLELIAWLCDDGSVPRLLVLTDGSRRYSDVGGLVTKWAGRLTAEAHPRLIGAKALRAALARETPRTVTEGAQK